MGLAGKATLLYLRNDDFVQTLDSRTPLLCSVTPKNAMDKLQLCATAPLVQRKSGILLSMGSGKGCESNFDV